MFKCNTCLYENQPYNGIECWNCYNNSRYVSAEREENMENKNYIVINGKKAELTEEQLKQLGIEVEKPNPYERAKEGNIYYYVNDTFKMVETFECNSYGALFDKAKYECGNYCTDENIANQDMLHDLLNRKLRQFSNLNGGIDLNSGDIKKSWDNIDSKKYCFYYDYEDEIFVIDSVRFIKRNQIYFISPEIAKRAIEEIIKPFMEEHKEFVW